MKKYLIFISILLIISVFGFTMNNNEKITTEEEDTSLEDVSYAISPALYDGQNVITGCIKTNLVVDQIKIHICRPNKNMNWEEIKIKNGKNKLYYDKTTGNYQLILREILQKDQLVRIEIYKKKGPSAKEELLDFSYPAVKVKDSPVSIRPLYEGSKRIEGEINLSVNQEIQAIFNLIHNNEPLWSKIIEPNGHKNLLPIDEKLDFMLCEGDKLKITLLNNRTKLCDFSKEFTVTSSTIDWGKIRCFLTYGLNLDVNLSSKEKKFESLGSYLDFFMDTHWTLWKKRKNKGIVAYVGVRIYSESQNSLGEDSETKPPNDPENNTEESEEEVKKTTTFQFGGYIPLMFSEWYHNGRENCLFVAPIFKLGFQRFSGTLSEYAKQYMSQNHLYLSGSFGVRFGHYVKSITKNKAHYLSSYFDITVGQSQLTGVLRERDENNELPSDPIKNSLNVYFEGRVKIPMTPFTIGVDASANITRGDIPDDLRIIMGTRVDIKSLIDKVFSTKEF